MAIDAYKKEFEEVELFGKPALFTNSRIDRITVPKNLFCYDLRGSDYDPGMPVSIENKVGVNHAGAVLTAQPVKIPKSGYKRIRGQVNFLGNSSTIKEFCEKHGIEYLPDNRKFVLRPASPDEEGLFYSQEEKDEMLATIGHLRFDHGHNEQEFWHTWWQHNGDALNTAEFKDELKSFVDEMRSVGPIRDGDAMFEYCYSNGSKMDGGTSGSFGFIAESENYRYCLRCTPRTGEYSYIYIYDKRQQALNMAQKKLPSMDALLRERKHLNALIQACDEDVRFFSGANDGDAAGEYQGALNDREEAEAKLDSVEQQIAALKKVAGEFPVIGKVTFASDEELAYTEPAVFLEVIKEELPYRNSSGFRYEVLSDDPALRKAVDDELYNLFGEENPRALEDYGLTEKGRQALRNAENPNLLHIYNWFVVENFGRQDELRHDTDSLTGAIDCFNGLTCEEKRLCVTKDDVATAYLAITESGKTSLDNSWRENPRFRSDRMIEETAKRLLLSIAGLEQHGMTMTMGGM